jgi:hypothetical protein
LKIAFFSVLLILLTSCGDEDASAYRADSNTNDEIKSENNESSSGISENNETPPTVSSDDKNETFNFFPPATGVNVN